MILNHHPICLSIEGPQRVTAAPFKFNCSWIGDLSFNTLVKKTWAEMMDWSNSSTILLLIEKLKYLKQKVIYWQVKKQQAMKANLVQVEEQIATLFHNNPSHIFNAEDINLLHELTHKKNKILAHEEATWRLRSRAIWIEKGDKNTSFFHKYASQRRNHNTIWDLTDDDGNAAITDWELHSLAFNHFRTQYQASETENIDVQYDVLQLVMRFFNESKNQNLGKPVTLEELKDTIDKMPKDKSPGPDGWTQELFQHFFEIMGMDMLNVVEESRLTGKILGALNATFFTLIPKSSKPVNFNDFRPIALCNFMYKVISKTIANRLKDTLAKCISFEQFGFLKDRLIFDAVGITQESLHSAKLKKLNAVILKLDLKRAYDSVSWQYLYLLLDQIGLDRLNKSRIMGCLTLVNTVVLVNGTPTDFFRCHRGLRQGYPMSPMLFLLVIEALNRMINQAVETGTFKGLKVAPGIHISHLLFVDDVLIMGADNIDYWKTLKILLTNLCLAT
jgi:hypothetical protein